MQNAMQIIAANVVLAFVLDRPVSVVAKIEM